MDEDLSRDRPLVLVGFLEAYNPLWSAVKWESSKFKVLKVQSRTGRKPLASGGQL
jgi:hypothetical protein